MKRARVNKQKGGPVLKETVQVFCRVRPHPSSQASTNETACLRIAPPCHIHLLPPSSANRNVPTRELQYTFKHVFSEIASQKDVFEEVALPLIKGLLAGKSSLLFTYGVTGSGKTYTMTGTLQDGGIMPRCFDAIFDSISECQAKRNIFKPDKLNGFEILSEGDADFEGELQARIATAKMHKLEKKNSDPDLAQRVRDQSYALPVEPDFCYAVFITYIEIYNNSVYDLLEDIYEDNNTRIRPLNSKIVREDSNHNMFVHGVNEIEVTSTDEAFEAYFYGQKRRRIAQTALNAESSRSHSVFNIRLVQAPANERGNGVDLLKKYIIVSQLSLVDLAGSERTNRTKNTGMRLKEAGNINNSLLTLRLCLELLRENQNGGNKMIPYRDSRLTHLFRNFFDGDGQVSMIICVNPLVEECEETMQVLKFAESSQEIVTTVQTPLRPANVATPGRKRTHEAYDHAARDFLEDKRARGDFRSQSLPDLLENVPDVRILDFANKENFTEFKSKLENVKSQMESVRKWDFTSLRHKIVKFERDTYVAVNQSKTLEQQCQLERDRVSTLENRIQLSEREQMKLKRKLEEAENSVKKLKGDLAAKDVLIKRKNLEQEKAKEEFSNKMVQAQDKLNREVERKLKSQRAAWESEMKHQEGRIRMARQVLSNEAKMDLPAYATPSRSRVPPSKSVESIPSSLKGVSVAGVKSTLFNSTPSVTAVTNAPNHQFSGVGNTPRPTARKGVPVVNRRYRRSRSVDNDVWLEHRPVHEVPTNTVMQPVMSRRKSVTQLTDSKDVTEKANKYCLLTQNQDSDGDLETRLYKGDVIPTAGGGAQVTFNDVEVLKQVSPSGSPTRKTPMQIRQDLEAACAQSTESYRFPHQTRSHTQSRRRQD
uniref:Kinesin-like protein n=1 Tax=Lygus hesperus TaxID=30085 RepID=A0A0A9YR00_LYGHE